LLLLLDIILDEATSKGSSNGTNYANIRSTKQIE
jgi:hypothetical protein